MTHDGLKAIAKVYTRHKAVLISLMNDHDAGITKGTSHKETITKLKYLIDNSLDFNEDLSILMEDAGIISPDWNNALDPVTAIAEAGGKLFEGIGTIVGTIGRRKQLELQQEMQEDKFFQDYLLHEQSKSNGGKILIISGITFVAIGITMFLVFRRKRQKNG